MSSMSTNGVAMTSSNMPVTDPTMVSHYNRNWLNKCACCKCRLQSRKGLDRGRSLAKLDMGVAEWMLLCLLSLTI